MKPWEMALVVFSLSVTSLSALKGIMCGAGEVAQW